MPNGSIPAHERVTTHTPERVASRQTHPGTGPRPRPRARPPAGNVPPCRYCHEPLTAERDHGGSPGSTETDYYTSDGSIRCPESPREPPYYGYHFPEAGAA